MPMKFFRARDLLYVAAWVCIGVAACPPGAAFFWLPIAFFYLLVLVAKLVMLLHPTTRRRTSLRLMCLGPAVFLMLLPIHIHRFNAARRAGDQVVMHVDQYRQIHGTYPANEQALGLDQGLKKTRFLYYRNVDKPIVVYSSPLIPFDTYYFDFERRAWLYHPD